MATNPNNASRKVRVDEMPHELKQSSRPNSLVRAIQANFETVSGVFRRLAHAHNNLDDDVSELYDRVGGEVLPGLANHTHAGGGGGGGSGVGGGAISHDSLTGVTTDQHHTKSHAHLADGSGTVAHTSLSVVGANDHHTQLHATAHKSGGGDAVKLDELAAPTDVTTLNASPTAHGLLPKLNNISTNYLDGTGAWSTPAGGGGGTGTRAFAFFVS